MVEVKVSKGHRELLLALAKNWTFGLSDVRHVIKIISRAVCSVCTSAGRQARRGKAGNPSAFCGTIANIHDHCSKMAAPMDERISVPIDDPNADTEWYCSILRKF
jgi:hypothetical protein